MRKTKIVCTLGPATDDLSVLRNICLAGMDVARLNFSHGSFEEHEKRIKSLRQAAADTKKRVAIMLDTKGPEIRVGTFRDGFAELKAGCVFSLVTEKVLGNNERAHINYAGLPQDVNIGDKILLDDGLIELRVEDKGPGQVICRVINGGKLFAGKGVNLPGVKINLPAMSKKDREDLLFGFTQDIDFVAVSFVRKASDILDIRRLAEEHNANVSLIAKIESQEAVENFAEILEVSDGIMIARGDLGVEISAEEVPLVQKMIVEACNKSGKPVITATQMLESMIRNPRPTRAEASDVANAIFDGTDAVMLSGETAVGAFPVQAVQTMARIAERTEKALQYQQILEFFKPVEDKKVTEAIGYATCYTAQELGVSAIITSTQSGHTARMVSKFKPEARIVAVTTSEKIANHLMLVWGVFPVVTAPSRNTDEMFENAMTAALQEGYIKNGDMVVLTAGVHVGVPGTTNLLRVDTVGEIILKATGVGKEAATGLAFVVKDEVHMAAMRQGQVLVSKSTDSTFLPYMKKASGLIVEEGGLTSHAAIVGINLGIPVIVGAKNATSIIKENEMVTIDPVRGLVYRGKAKIL
ncbi:MAG: pyruvate kinase [Firmicutes bacterium]|nr:pyruvate kinase [Bacillota bacterium]